MTFPCNRVHKSYKFLEPIVQALESMRRCHVRSKILLGPCHGVALGLSGTDATTAASGSQRPTAADRALGTWRLNIAKSKFNPGPPPESQTRTYELYRDGIRTTVRNGVRRREYTFVQFVSDYRGDQVPISGSPDADMIALKSVDADTAEADLYHAGRAIGRVRRVISRDGQTMTITVELNNVEGVRVTNVQVFEKQQTPP